jgi:predicted enzyme related to lactoylglutathione lyase
MEMKEYAPGTFCWVDLMSTDAAASKKFYSALFGWECKDMPMGDNGVYSMCELRGKEVCAISSMPPDMQKSIGRSVWQSYISVKSANEAEKSARANGGTIVAPPFDVFDAGRMTVVSDPSGAVVSLWEARNHHGASLVNEPGALAWNELLTRDPAAAKKFYVATFGWKGDDQDMGPMGTYTVFKVGERNNAGMMKMPEEAGPTPSNWQVYFAVADCDAAVKKAQGLGAKMHVPPTDIPGTGRFAMLEDPQGGVFSVIALAPM